MFHLSIFLAVISLQSLFIENNAMSFDVGGSIQVGTFSKGTEKSTNDYSSVKADIKVLQGLHVDNRYGKDLWTAWVNEVKRKMESIEKALENQPSTETASQEEEEAKDYGPEIEELLERIKEMKESLGGDSVSDELTSVQKKLTRYLEDIAARNGWTVEDIIGGKCPTHKGYKHENGMCFKIHTEAWETWDVARAVCEADDPYGRLLVLDDKKKFDAMKYFVKSSNAKKSYNVYCFWLGAQTYNHPKFYWLNGKPVDKSAWGYREPNNAGNYEFCYNMRRQASYTANDASCITKCGFICEKIME